MANRMFICPKNDLEAVSIVNYLQRNGEQVLITNQNWGASWDGLESEIKEVLNKNSSRTKLDKVEKEDTSPLSFTSKGTWTVKEYDKTETIMYGGHGTSNIEKKNFHGTHEEYLNQQTNDPGWNAGHVISKSSFIRDKIQEIISVNDSVPVYGIELQGEAKYNGIINIDHHNENSHKASSIEQVAEIVGVPLTLREKFIAANDSGYIPAMEQLGKNLGLSEQETATMISEIRLMDRQCQGITQEQEEVAQKTVDALNISEKQGLILIENLPHSKCATITDRLYGKYENLLICSTDGEINFYGNPEIVKGLSEEFQGWNGQGFWGSSNADRDAVILDVMAQSINTVDCTEAAFIDYNEIEVDKELEY